MSPDIIIAVLIAFIGAGLLFAVEKYERNDLMADFLKFLVVVVPGVQQSRTNCSHCPVLSCSSQREYGARALRHELGLRLCQSMVTDASPPSPHAIGHGEVRQRLEPAGPGDELANGCTAIHAEPRIQ